jgi:hypothetical protein
MIKETTGNLFEAKAEALINTVNCVGVRIKGIALRFTQKWIKIVEIGNIVINLALNFPKQ